MIAWFGNAALLTSIWRLGNKNRDAWVWSMVGNILWAAYGIKTGLWSVVFIDGVMIFIAYRNWKAWL